METNAQAKLLLFRSSLDELREQWDMILPNDWSGIVVSGGMPDFSTRKESLVDYLSGRGPFPGYSIPAARTTIACHGNIRVACGERRTDLRDV